MDKEANARTNECTIRHFGIANSRKFITKSNEVSSNWFALRGIQYLMNVEKEHQNE